MAAAAGAIGGRVEEKREEVPLLPVIALPVASFPDAVSRMDVGVPRKARSGRRRAIPSGWWAFRLPVPQLKKAGNRRRSAAPSVPDSDVAARTVNKARRCLQCGSEVTPQWRSGPMGRSTLCNACGVRLWAVGALRETEHRPRPAKARKVARPPTTTESPGVDSSPDSHICKHRRGVSLEDVYLVRRQPNQQSRPPPPEEETYLVKKKKPAKKKKPWKPRNTGYKCQHCGSTSTPQWREGPMGRHTLCNACGVRYRQGRLLPEYRPAASPTFVASQHASRHREVLALHKQQNKDQPAPVGEDGRLPNQHSGDAPASEADDPYNVVLLRRQPAPADKDWYPRAGGNIMVQGCGGGDELVDSLLLDGPSAPLLVDGDDSLLSISKLAS